MGLTGEIKGQYSEKHEHAAEKGVKKEFNRGILSSGPAPNPDQEVHGEEHQLPKDIKEKKIEGDENPHHSRIEQEEEGEVTLHRFIDSPGGEDAEKAEERGQEHHRDADPVNADKIVDVIRWDPGRLFHELEARVLQIEVYIEPNGEKVKE
jgi:hypothetical protein